jgi:hypothetical protein
MSKVVRLPDTLADFFKKYPSVINELVNQINDGALSLNIDVTATNTDIQEMINNAIAPLLVRLEAIENTRSEATDTANFMSALHQKVKGVAQQHREPIQLNMVRLDVTTDEDEVSANPEETIYDRMRAFASENGIEIKTMQTA